MWVRGLKLVEMHAKAHGKVAPYVGAWIETNNVPSASTSWQVAPYVGAWIETAIGR